MNMISAVSGARVHASDLVLDALQSEFGAVLAERIFEAEAVDFLWELRVEERYLGQHFSSEFDVSRGDEELSRVAILSSWAGIWHVGMCLVDGEGCAVELLWKRQYDSRGEADAALRGAQ